LILKIVWKRNKDEWCSVTSQKNTVFSYAAEKTVKFARTSFIKEIKVYNSYIITFTLSENCRTSEDPD
jgi:hypothetical protein